MKSKCPWCGGSGVDYYVLVNIKSRCPLCKGERHVPTALDTAYCLIRNEILFTANGTYRKHHNIVRRLEQLRYDILHKEQ